MPIDKKVTVLYDLSLRKENEKDYSEALNLVNWALHWVHKEVSVNRDEIKLYQKLQFLKGKMVFYLKSKREGIALMQYAIDRPHDEYPDYHNDSAFLAMAMLKYGEKDEELNALNRIVKSIAYAGNVQEDTIINACRIIIKQENHGLMEKLILGAIDRTNYAFWITDAIWDYLGDQYIYYWNTANVIRLLKSAINFAQIGREKRQMYAIKIRELEERVGLG